MNGPLTYMDIASIDEHGEFSCDFGPYIMRSVFQPIFPIDGDMLVPEAVEGLLKVTREKQTIPPTVFFANVPAEYQVSVERRSRATHLHNFAALGRDHLDLFFNFNPAAYTDLADSLEKIRYMMSRLPVCGLTTDRLICEITEANACDNTVLRAIVKEFRRNGFRIAIDDFGTEFSNIERVEALSPDIVKIDGDWFRQMAAVSRAETIITSVIRNFRNAGIQVLVEGIETSCQLELAVNAGADKVQGYLLGKPSSVREHPDWSPIPLSDFIAPPKAVAHR